METHCEDMRLTESHLLDRDLLPNEKVLKLRAPARFCLSRMRLPDDKELTLTGNQADRFL